MHVWLMVEQALCTHLPHVSEVRVHSWVEEWGDRSLVSFSADPQQLETLHTGRRRGISNKSVIRAYSGMQGFYCYSLMHSLPQASVEKWRTYAMYTGDVKTVAPHGPMPHIATTSICTWMEAKGSISSTTESSRNDSVMYPTELPYTSYSVLCHVHVLQHMLTATALGMHCILPYYHCAMLSCVTCTVCVLLHHVKYQCTFSSQ